MKKFFLVFLTALVFTGSAFAQVVDVRELSRRRKYEAYHAPAPEAVRQETVQPNAFRQNTEKSVRSDAATPSRHMAAQGQTKKEQPRIQQKGFKIFQEKDEDKVMNFNVDNPEFRKLNREQQQDLLNRIKFE